MLHAAYCVRKYFKVFGIECSLGANPKIKEEKRIPVVLSQREIRDLLNQTTIAIDFRVAGQHGSL